MQVPISGAQKVPMGKQVAKCGDGYMCFESWDDYNVWKNQK